MALPISMLWEIQMSLRRKAVLVGIFSLAIITTVFAIIRSTIVSSLNHRGFIFGILWNTELVRPSLCFKHEKYPRGSSCPNICLSAIMVSCLASFRSLFVQQRERPRKPTYYFQDTIRNIFLRDRHRVGHSKRSAGIDGVPSCNELAMQSFKPDQPGNSEVASDSAITNWTEPAVSASIVCPKANV